MHIPQDRSVYRVYQTTYDMLKKIADQNPVFNVIVLLFYEF